MKILIVLVLLLSPFVSTSSAATHRTRNFVVTANGEEFARQCGNVCEQSRIKLAEEWVGRRLPDWPRPCTVRVTIKRMTSGGGSTHFAFMQGRAFGFRMSVVGSKERVLLSVLPHEVCHTVFATAIGRPLPRWCDEGACMLAEIPVANRLFVDRARHMARSGRHIPVRIMFAMTQYPRDVAKLLDLYAQGHMIASHLVAKKGKRQFFEFMREGANERNLKRWYGLSLPQLQSEWITAVQRGDQPTMLARSKTRPRTTTLLAQATTGNPPTLPTSRVSAKPKLFVYGAAWCDPCKAAKAHKKAGQWQVVAAKYEVVFQDVDLHEERVAQLQIKNIPSFVIGNRIVAQGYRGPEWLVRQLELGQAICDNCPSPQTKRPPATRQQPRRRAPTRRRPPVVPPPTRPTSTQLRQLQEMAIAFVKANPEMFKGDPGDKGDKGDAGNPGTSISDVDSTEKINAAIALWFSNNPTNATINAEQTTLALTKYFNEHPLPDFGSYVTKLEFNEAINNLVNNKTPHVLPTQKTHIVIVADKDANYWPRLEKEIKEAENYASRITVAPPPSKFTVEHPQIVFYKDGSWKKRFVGSRAVSEILNQIAREEYKW